MKKLILLLLIAPVLGFGQISFDTFDIDNVNTIDYITLSNGNRLNFGIANLNFWNQNSLFQCSEYDFEDRYWIYELNSNNEVVNEICYSKEDILNSDTSTAMDNAKIRIGQSCLMFKTIRKIDDEIIFDFVGDYASVNSNTSDYSLLLKFDLNLFKFVEGRELNLKIDEDQYSTALPHKLMKFSHNNTYGWYSFFYIKQYEDFSGVNNINNIHSQGYQKFYSENSDLDFYVNSILSDGNSTQIILNYKKDDNDSFSVLVLSKSTSGTYDQNQRGQASLFIIKFNVVEYTHSVVKTDVPINYTQGQTLSYFPCFVDSNNDFIFQHSNYIYKVFSDGYFN